MDKTVAALKDLSATDRQLRADATRMKDVAGALEKRRAALRDSIPDAFLAAYDALGRIGRHPALVEVRSSHCGGCYLRLPPQLDSAIRLRQSLRVCPHCRRLLYRPAPAEEARTENESGHAPAPSPRRGASSKRARRISGRRISRQERPTAERQERL